MSVEDIPAEYTPTVGATGARRASGIAAGDAARAAEIIVAVAHRADTLSHLLLGRNAAQMAIDYSRRQLEEALAWRDVSVSADAAEEYPVELPAAA